MAYSLLWSSVEKSELNWAKQIWEIEVNEEGPLLRDGTEWCKNDYFMIYASIGWNQIVVVAAIIMF